MCNARPIYKQNKSGLGWKKIILHHQECCRGHIHRGQRYTLVEEDKGVIMSRNKIDVEEDYDGKEKEY